MIIKTLLSRLHDLFTLCRRAFPSFAKYASTPRSFSHPKNPAREVSIHVDPINRIITPEGWQTTTGRRALKLQCPSDGISLQEVATLAGM